MTLADGIEELTIGALPDWGRDTVEDFLGTLGSTESPFPCTFAVAAARRKTLRFGFVPDLSEKSTWRSLPDIMREYLRIYQGLTRETSLVIFFGDSAGDRDLDDYFARFWSVLQYLHDTDGAPWPAELPADPEHPLWEFSFAGTEIFVVCNNPAYEHRHSRHSPRFVLTFQPRWVFDGLEPESPRGLAARRVIRKRLRAFDGQEPAAELGGYGDPDNREWRQYFLPDRNTEQVPGCPFLARPNENPSEPEPTVDNSGLRGKVAVVTGAAQGIGAAVVAALADRGAVVGAIDVNESLVTQLAKEHLADGRAVRAFCADVSSPAAVDAAIAAVEAELGPIGLLANVAGVLRPAPVLAAEDQDWASTFAVNTDGVFYASRAVARRMVPRGAGAIITVSSNAGGVPRTNMAAYAASKAAATMFTRCLGLELARSGIRCNVVSPGSTDTAMQQMLGAAPEAVIAGDPGSYRVGIPLGRIADPADIADAVVFLASDQARHITMQDLYVDGGATLRA